LFISIRSGASVSHDLAESAVPLGARMAPSRLRVHGGTARCSIVDPRMACWLAPARRFPRPVLVFNLHDQFERLRAEGRYERMREAILERDRKLAGDVNPMLVRFGEASEARQYSGRAVGEEWECPFRDPREG